MSCKNGKSLGWAGENAAVAWLVAHGYQILDRNWRYGKWELDIVCRFRDTVHFVEVKTRSRTGFGGAAEAVSPAQKRRLLMAAQAWLNAREMWEAGCQFDILCLTASGESLSVERYANAFDWEIVGGGDAHWPY